MAASVLKETRVLLSSTVLNRVVSDESCSRSDSVSFINGSSISRASCLFCHSIKSSKPLYNSHKTFNIVRKKSSHVVFASSSEISTQNLDVPLESDIEVSYEELRDLLAAGEWEKADAETRRLMCVLAGEEAVKRKWVYFTEVQFMPSTDLLTIDTLWRKASGDKFGFSIQRRLWNSLGQRWKPFFLKIDWTYGVNNTCRKFPMEFSWDISAPVGHLPLTNALRGTQLLESLLSHPAFSKFDAENTLPITETRASDSASATNSKKEDKPKSDASNVLGDIFKSSDYGF